MTVNPRTVPLPTAVGLLLLSLQMRGFYHWTVFWRLTVERRKERKKEKRSQSYWGVLHKYLQSIPSKMGMHRTADAPPLDTEGWSSVVGSCNFGLSRPVKISPNYLLNQLNPEKKYVNTSRVFTKTFLWNEVRIHCVLGICRGFFQPI